MQEHRILEKEVKGLLLQRVYDHLYKEVAWDTKNVQVNFYYSNEYILNKLQFECEIPDEKLLITEMDTVQKMIDVLQALYDN